MRTIYCLLLMLCPYLSMAQPAVNSFTIGDTVTSLTVPAAINQYNLPATLAGYRGKWLLIDFMGLYCSGCIKALPQLNRLQQQSNGQLQVILVSKENRDRVNNFFQKSPLAKTVTLPFIAADTSLQSRFPFQYLSHIIWINPSGVVAAITGMEEVTEQNLQIAFSGQPLSLPVKNDFVFYDDSRPLLAIAQNTVATGYNAMQGYSTFLNAIPGLPPAHVKKTNSCGNITRLTLVNKPVIDMLRYSFGRIRFPAAYISLQVKDSNRLLYNSSLLSRKQWETKNLFCYEAFFPAGASVTAMQQKLQSDISFYFGYQASLKKVSAPCLIITATDTTPPTLQQTIPLTNITDLLFDLNNSGSFLPILDERVTKQKTVLPAATRQCSNTASLQQQLAKYGLLLTPAIREMEMMLITDKPDY